LEYFKTKGSSHESEVLKIMNMVSTVKRGFNPIKMEKITGRRDLLWGFSFNGIESIYDILMEIYTKETKSWMMQKNLFQESSCLCIRTVFWMMKN
jgi:hypothetical protein